MNLFVILLVVVTVFLLLIKLFASLTGRVSERLLTSYFRDLEALLAHKQLPTDWVAQLKKIARRGADQTRSTGQLPWESAAKAFLLKKISALHKYFETSPFVESPEVRALLLEQLQTLIEHWERSALSEILAEYDLPIPNSFRPRP